MMDFIYELYQNDNFVLYLTIALVILIVLFVLVLIFGKRDQKLEETKRLQKIDVDAFKEEKNDEVAKVEVKEEKQENVTLESAENKEEVKTEVTEEKVTEEVKTPKSIFDDTQVLPIAKKEIKEDSEEVNVTTFEPISVEENKEDVTLDKEEKHENNTVKPLLSDMEEEDKPIKLDEINFDDLTIEKDLGELENIKNEFDSIKIPDVKEINTETKKEKVIERNETKPFKPGPQVFSSVFVKKEEPVIEGTKEEINPEEKKEEVSKTSLFSIQDDDEEAIELPPLKMPKKKEENKEEAKAFNFDDISGETYNIK